MEEWISKKDLLTETGISYGQLYRWKREKLIPDAWFVKRASYTGQETFLPRERTLERIRFILEKKDEYSLGQLQEMLTPNADSRVYTAEAISALPGAMRPTMAMAELSGTQRFNHGQAVCILIGTRASEACQMDDDGLAELMKALNRWQTERNFAQNSDGRLVVLEREGRCLPLYLHPSSEIELPEGTRAAYTMELADIPAHCNKQLNALYEEA